MSALFGKPQETGPNVSFNLNRPTWYQNSSKRVIPNHLVPKKKTGFQISTATTKKDSGKTAPSARSANSDTADFSIISFGSAMPHNTLKPADSALLLTGDANDTISLMDHDDFPLYNDNEDLPPTRSIYDLNDEVMIALNKPAQHTGSFINKDPRNFVNVFSHKSDIPVVEDNSQVSKTSLQNFESAVLVFGYPEHMSSQVTAFFLEFGNILENFETLNRSKHDSDKLLESLAPTSAFSSGDDTKAAGKPAVSAPIFSGKSWVKITYDNPSSAFDALQESGSVFNGVLIGVVPYSKDSVEKLQQRKMSVLEDIGGGVDSKSEREQYKSKKGALGESADLQNTYIKRLEVKDGSDIFLKANADGKDQDKATRDGKKLGIVGTLTNYLFGFYDL